MPASLSQKIIYLFITTIKHTIKQQKNGLNKYRYNKKKYLIEFQIKK